MPGRTPLASTGTVVERLPDGGLETVGVSDERDVAGDSSSRLG